ncbi:hypothetical protein EV641_11821 [Rhodococcus sp. SMB37]|nr:hypothetical protein EV641_11821 [Rhodococcus sp. SMB37]
MPETAQCGQTAAQHSTRVSSLPPLALENPEPRQSGADLPLEIAGFGGGCSRQRTQHHIGTFRNRLDELDADMTKPARDSMSNHRRPDSLAHDESETRTVDTTHHEIRLLPL